MAKTNTQEVSVLCSDCQFPGDPKFWGLARLEPKRKSSEKRWGRQPEVGGQLHYREKEENHHKVEQRTEPRARSEGSSRLKLAGDEDQDQKGQNGQI